MVHLEHSQSRERIAIGERIEARAEDDVLPHAAPVRLAELILGKPTPRGEGRAKKGIERRLVAERGVPVDDGERERIIEDDRLVEKLMRRPPLGDPLGGPARSVHGGSLTAP